MIKAAMNDSAEVLRRAEMNRAERSVQGGLLGPAAVNAQILTVYAEYQRRAETILESIRKVLNASSFRHYRQLDADLRKFFLDQCSQYTTDIEARLSQLPVGGKPNFAEFKTDLCQRMLVEVSLAIQNYVTHHREVVNSWCVLYGTNVLKWIIGIVTALLIAWLTKLWI